LYTYKIQLTAKAELKMVQSYDAIVVGMGITGAATAYFLKKSGAGRVLLLDRKGIAAGGTGRSAAIIRQHYSTALLARLTLEGIDILKSLPDETGNDPGFSQVGWFFLVPPDLVDGARENISLQQGIGVRTSFVDQAEYAERLPWLNPDGVGAVVHEPDGGYVDPVMATEALVNGFKKLGGEVRTNTPCRELIREGNKITGVILDEGPVTANAVVNAAGPWSHLLAASAGLELPLRVVREQDSVWQVRHPADMPAQSISNAVDAIYLRPLGEGRYVIGRGFPKEYVDVDPYNFKDTEDDDFVTDIATRAEGRFPAFAGAQLLHGYGATYDVSPDWYPIVGPRSEVEGYFDASGGSGHGFKIGFAIGRELSDWILRGQAPDDFSALSHDRFAAGKTFVQKYGGNRG
jgi:sarcosine oxidase, subunit beta